MPAMTLHGPDGFGLTQYSGDEYALVGGFRDGASNAGELRLKYQIYSHALIDANNGDFAKGEIGYCVVRVASDDGEDQGNDKRRNKRINSNRAERSLSKREISPSRETVKEETLTVEEQLQEDLAKEKDKFLRLFAEFENYKKRTTKERIELFKTASQDVMVSMLPVLDDFERALMHIEEDKEAEELRKGVLLIYNKLISTLEQKGLAKIEVNQGDVFNAQFLGETNNYITIYDRNARFNRRLAKTSLSKVNSK